MSTVGRTSEAVLPLYNLNHLPAPGFTLLMSGDAVQLTGINPGRCPRCGGELEFKANVGSLGEGSETYFSECSDCDHIHTVNEKRVNTDADRYLREFTVFIVDDDQGVLNALSSFLRAAGYETKAYSSPHAFLDEHDPSMPGCAVLDLAMPGMNGLGVQHELVTRGIERPIIFLTGRGTVPASVEAMKAGAVDFLPKPFKDAELLNAIKVAEKRYSIRLQRAAEQKAISKRIAKLTLREKEVMELVVHGHLNKTIAHLIGTVEKTVKVHRGRVMKKLGVKSVAELVRLASKVLSEPR